MIERSTPVALAVVHLSLALFPVSGFADEDCKSPATTKTVLAIVKKNSRLPSGTEYGLSSIRTTGKDPKTGATSCAADVTGEFRGAPYAASHLTYSLEPQPDGNVTITVEGISGLKFPY